MRKRTLLIIFVFLLPNFILAQKSNNSYQPDEDDDPYDQLSYFFAGLNYLSNNVYLGRKDSVAIPYIIPYIGYHLSNGLYAKAMASYTSAGSSGHIDLFTLEAGYNHSFSKNINAGFSAEKYFYNKNSISVRANSSGYFGIDGQFTNDYVEPSAQLGMVFNKNTKDYVLGIAIDHNFSMNEGKFSIIPTITVFSGTQNYYDEYFLARAKKKDKKAVVPNNIVSNPSAFNVLDYEFSAKTTFRAKHWLFTIIPTYAMPMNPAIITLPQKPKPQKEKISDSFFIEIDVCFRG